MTQAQWFSRIQSWVPDWVLAENTGAPAIFQAIAAVMAAHDAERDALQDETFIADSDFPWLDAHGHERNVSRGTSETDINYRIRVRYQNLSSQCQLAALKAIVNALLLNGPCEIREDFKDDAYCSRKSFCNRDTILVDDIKDAFTIVIPVQHHAPYSFCSRGNFAGRSTFAGTSESSNVIYQNIINAVNANRAMGAAFRINVSKNTTVF